MTTKEIMERERWATEEAIIKGNIDALDEVFDPDTAFHVPPFPDYKGLEEFKQGLMRVHQALTDIRWKWDEVIIEGNTAVQRFTFRGKHTGTTQMLPVEPTGKEFILEGCTVYHIKNGKIVEFFEYSNYLGFFQQLGVIPPLGPCGE